MAKYAGQLARIAAARVPGRPPRRSDRPPAPGNRQPAATPAGFVLRGPRRPAELGAEPQAERRPALGRGAQAARWRPSGATWQIVIGIDNGHEPGLVLSVQTTP